MKKRMMNGMRATEVAEVEAGERGEEGIDEGRSERKIEWKGKVRMCPVWSM